MPYHVWIKYGGKWYFDSVEITLEEAEDRAHDCLVMDGATATHINPIGVLERGELVDKPECLKDDVP